MGLGEILDMGYYLREAIIKERLQLRRSGREITCRIISVLPRHKLISITYLSWHMHKHHGLMRFLLLWESRAMTQLSSSFALYRSCIRFVIPPTLLDHRWIRKYTYVCVCVCVVFIVCNLLTYHSCFFRGKGHWQLFQRRDLSLTISR